MCIFNFINSFQSVAAVAQVVELERPKEFEKEIQGSNRDY